MYLVTTVPTVTIIRGACSQSADGTWDIKRDPWSLQNIEMQIKTTTKSLQPTTVVLTRKTGDSKGWKCGKTQTFTYCGF